MFGTSASKDLCVKRLAELNYKNADETVIIEKLDTQSDETFLVQR